MEILTVRYDDDCDNFVIYTEEDHKHSLRQMIALDRKYGSGTITYSDGSKECFVGDGDWLRWECPFRWTFEPNYGPYHGGDVRFRFNKEDVRKRVCEMCCRIAGYDPNDPNDPEIERVKSSISLSEPPCPCYVLGEAGAVRQFIETYGLED